MELSLRLALPRDSVSVPLARRVLRSSLDALGVTADVVSDIELVVTEACTNVLDHADEADDFEVCVGLDGAVCVIEVIDRGSEFDGTDLGRSLAQADAEEGRGIRIMRDLLDRLSFESIPSGGSVVRMEKQLELEPASPLAALEAD